MLLWYNIKSIGVSSSGKTQHFDCCIHWFESSYPSGEKASFGVLFSYFIEMFTQMWYTGNDKLTHRSIIHGIPGFTLLRY